MSNVTGNLFQNYLLNNEKWLATEGEEKGQHQVDGQLDESEISVFFSSSHIEFGGESGDGEISDSEFESWYAANESAISAFLEANDMDYESGKDAMRESMVDFAHSLDSEYIAEEHGMSVNSLDMNGVWNDRSNAGLPPAVPADEDQTPVEEPKDEPVDDATSTTIGETEATQIAAKLFAATEGKIGSDKNVLNQYLLSDDYTSADLVMIMNAYQKTYDHSLLLGIEGEVGMRDSVKATYREKLYDAAAEEAQKAYGWTNADDIPADIREKTEKLYNDINGYYLGTSNPTMQEFHKINPYEKAQIMAAFDMLYSNDSKSALSEITKNKNYGIAYGASEDQILDSIMKSLLAATSK